VAKNPDKEMIEGRFGKGLLRHYKTLTIIVYNLILTLACIMHAHYKPSILAEEGRRFVENRVLTSFYNLYQIKQELTTKNLGIPLEELLQ
jgi:hypothetical protein